MSRNENEDVSDLELPDPQSLDVTFILEKGLEVKLEEYNDQNKHTICAKSLKHKGSGKTTYYILCGDGSTMFNPNNKDVGYKRRNVWKYRKVNKSTFDLYLLFLKNSYNSLLFQAERGL